LILNQGAKFVNKKGELKLPFFVKINLYMDYSAGFGASTGQTAAQDPQSTQSSASMTNLSSPSLIAETVHSPSQAPQLMHSELITYAMYNIPLFLDFGINIPKLRKKGKHNISKQIIIPKLNSFMH